MDIRFDGKVVLITGASSGIGAALARAFGASGAKVVVHYHRKAEGAQQVAADIRANGGEALVLHADLTDRAQLEKLVDDTLAHYGCIDVLINNAGSIVGRAPVDQASDELYHAVMDVNMTSTFQMCRKVLPVMKAQGGGNIINMSSISGRHGGGGSSTLYAAAKAAVATFTRGLAKEVAAHNIRVNALAPGVILTPFHEGHSTPEQMQGWMSTIPMRRFAQPEECVGAAFFLASDQMSSYVTGQIIEINGGQLMP